MQRLILQETNSDGRFELRRLSGVSGERALLLVDEPAFPTGTHQAAFQLNVSEARKVVEWLTEFCGAATQP